MRFLSPSTSLLLATLMVVSPLPAQSRADNSSPAVSGGEIQLRVIDSDGTSAPTGSHTKKGITIEVTDENGAPAPGAAVTFHLPDNGPTGRFEDGSIVAVAYTNAAGRAHAGNVVWSNAAGVADIRITAAKGTAHTGILFEETLTPAGDTAQATAVRPEIPAKQPTQQIAQVRTPVAHAAAADATLSDSSTVKPRLTSASAAAPPDQKTPSVSVTGATQGASSSHSKAKWFVIAAIAIGAGAGVALAAKGKSSASSTPQTAQLSIGTPSISVGHP